MSSESPATPPKPKMRRVLLVICVFAITPWGWPSPASWDRAKSRQEVADWTNAQTIPTVRVVQPERGPEEQSLILPGNVAAFNTGSLFARARRLHRRLEQRYWRSCDQEGVRSSRRSRPLISINSSNRLLGATFPFSCEAAVQQAQANADLGCHATDQRTSQLVVQGWQSKQQGDNDRLNAASQLAGLAVAKANVVAQQSAVKRREELNAFEEIKAPFDGVVTACATSTSATSSTQGATRGAPCSRVSDIHRMRIFVNVLPSLPRRACAGHQGHAASARPEGDL